jgi:hypothetical protein
MFDFKHPDENIQLSFRVLPMFHIGTKMYYDNVMKKLSACDEILYEGFNFKRIRFQTQQFKSIAKKLNLTTQMEGINLKKLNKPLIHSDLTTQQANVLWKDLRITEKLKFLIHDPIKSYYFAYGLNRKKLAKNFTTAANEQMLAYGPRFDKEGTAENLIMNEREKILIEILESRFHKQKYIDKKIGIIYGAGHMKRIVRYIIDQLGYVSQHAEFLEVYPILASK